MIPRGEGNVYCVVSFPATAPNPSKGLSSNSSETKNILSSFHYVPIPLPPNLYPHYILAGVAKYWNLLALVFICILIYTSLFFVLHIVFVVSPNIFD